jgi:WD40 repeat protein
MLAILSTNLCVFIAHSLLVLHDFASSKQLYIHQNTKPYATLHFCNQLLYAGETGNNGEIQIFRVQNNQLNRVQVLKGHKKGVKWI